MFRPEFVEKYHTFNVQNIFFPPENPAVYKIMWKYMADPDKSHVTNIIQHMGFVFWITKATNTHSDYVITIAFPQQEWGPPVTQSRLTFRRRNYFFYFSTPCIQNVNNTGTKYVRIMKQTAFLRKKTESMYRV